MKIEIFYIAFFTLIFYNRGDTIRKTYIPTEHRPFEELTITNDFLFAKVMQNGNLCKKFLELILSVRILRLEEHQEQKNLDIAYHSKGIRLDVYVDDDRGTIYDIEMQTGFSKVLPKRSRYYQGIIDLNHLEKGAEYSELPRSYIIFICTFDPFLAHRYFYTFENLCLEDNQIFLRDGTVKIFLNTKGSIGSISPKLQEVLDYFNGKPPGNGFAKELDNEVKRIKQNEKWRQEYMTLEMIKREQFQEGLELGKEYGLERGLERGLELGIAHSIQALRSFGAGTEEAFSIVAEQYQKPVEEILQIWEAQMGD